MYDAIVLGGGHNGLVTAGYLARAGWKVLVLERRPIVGGACVTEEVIPGYRMSTTAYLISLLQEPVIRELELARFGYQVLPKDPAYFAPYPDGRSMFLWQDLRRSCAEIARFSQADAEQYPAYEAFIERLARFVEPLLLETPPDLPPRSLDDWLAVLRLGRRALGLSREEILAHWRMLTASASDILDRWFESEQLKVALATDGVIGANGSPATPGTAYILLHHCMGGVGGHRGLWGFVKGGMGAVTQALARSAQACGAEVRTSAEVVKILAAGGVASGVAVADGSEYRARVVVSNADPKRTFLTLLDRDQLPPEFRRSVEQLKCEGVSFKVNLALDRLPSYTALPGTELGPQHMGTTHICPDRLYVERAWDDAKYGRPSREPMLEITIPTAYDPSLAPPGHHVMSIFVQYAPYRLAEGTWREEKDRFVDRVIDVLAAYAPNIREAIVGCHALSPLDLEEQFGMTGGNIFHGEMSADQLYAFRPLPGWARYATPVRNLYLCGSGTHPGGGIMGAPGRNAAREILRRARR
ncbi:MAG: NAD(P)/FAD-dependent oxidoreductase [Chloroflexi bacterium]|nr:NAD(P)/FAD-dependent oxidoreductase [Chloroflexota bacterium]